MAKVLYISEDRWYYEPFEDALRSEVLEVQHEDSVPEAETAIFQKPFDVIVLGMLIREGSHTSNRFSGLDLIEIIKTRGQNRDTPLVVQSVVDPNSIREELSAYGEIPYLMSPVMPSELVRVVKQALQHSAR